MLLLDFMRPDSVPDLGTIQIVYLLTYLLTYIHSDKARVLVPVRVIRTS